MGNKKGTFYQQENIEDEVTFKEVLLKGKEFFEEVSHNWKVLLYFIIPFVASFVLFAIFTPPVYPAVLTFMVNEEEGNGGISGVAAILGQFAGFAGGGASKFNLDKILELAKSRKIIQNALFQKYVIDEENDYLGNHLIREYNMHEEWDDNKIGLKDFTFIHNEIEEFNRQENKVLKILHNKLIGNEGVVGLVASSYNEDTGIMSISVSSTSEKLSIFLAEAIYKDLSKFYIHKSVERQRHTYEVVSAKTDSLEQELNRINFKLLQFKDENKGLTLRQYKSEEKALELESQKLILAYGEAYKNMEFAEFALKNQRPFIQEIDWPIEPIEKKGKSKIIAIIIGLFLGLLLSTIFILGRMMIKKNNYFGLFY